MVSTIGADASGPGLQHQRRHGRRRHRRGARRREGHLPHRRRGPARRRRRPGSLISRIDAAALQGLIDDGMLAGGMIPKIAACLARGRHGVGSAHLLDGRLPTCVLLELFTDAGVGTMITAGGAVMTAHARPWAPPPWTTARSCPPTRRRRCSSCGARAPGCGTRDGNQYLDLLAGLAVTSLGHSHPAVADALAEQAQHAAARLQPVRHRARAGGGRHPRPPARRRPPGWPAEHAGPGVLRQLRGRGQRVRPQAGPQVRRPGPPRRGERLRLVPRPHARHAPRHRPAGQARGLPAAARGLPPRRLGRPRRARRRRSTRRWPPCCSSRCRARAA